MKLEANKKRKVLYNIYGLKINNKQLIQQNSILTSILNSILSGQLRIKKKLKEENRYNTEYTNLNYFQSQKSLLFHEFIIFDVF